MGSCSAGGGLVLEQQRVALCPQLLHPQVVEELHHLQTAGAPDQSHPATCSTPPTERHADLGRFTPAMEPRWTAGKRPAVPSSCSSGGDCAHLAFGQEVVGACRALYRRPRRHPNLSHTPRASSLLERVVPPKPAVKEKRIFDGQTTTSSNLEGRGDSCCREAPATSFGEGMIPGLLGVVAMALPPTPAASLRQFLLGSWSVARTLEYSRGGATGPCRFQGKVRSCSPVCNL